MKKEMNQATIKTNADVACNAAEDANRYYLATKAFAEDSVEHRKRAEKSALDARHEARSAMLCVVWCFCAAVLSLLFAIAHFIL